MFLEVMIEDADYNEPTVEVLQDWSDQYGLTMPVLSDAGEAGLYSFATGSIGLPFTVLLDKGAVVVDANSPSVSKMDELLDN